MLLNTASAPEPAPANLGMEPPELPSLVDAAVLAGGSVLKKPAMFETAFETSATGRFLFPVVLTLSSSIES